MELKNYYAQDVNGNIVPGATCYLYLPGTTTLATGLQGPTGAPLTNPFNADSFGLVQFAAPNGTYDFRCVAGLQDSTIPIQFADPSAIYPLITQAEDAAADAADSAAAAAASAAAFVSFPGYAGLRAYSGSAALVHITGAGIEGYFALSATPSLADNSGTIIVDSLSRGWLRLYTGNISVTWFGAGSGADDTSAFSAAAIAAPSGMNITGDRGTGGIPRAPMCDVDVPYGNYTLTALVDVGNKDVTWIMSPATIVAGYNFINGNVDRTGQRYTGQAIGSVDYACGYSVRMNNPESDAIAEVTGVPTQAGFGRYGDRDTVGMYVDNTSRPAVISAATATYTATTATIGSQSSDTLKRLRVGMFIDTLHTPNRYTGILKSWNSDASVLTVDAWYLVNNVVNPPSTPPNSDGLKVNAYTKIWAHNANVYLNADGEAQGASGMEIGVFNFKGDSSTSIANNVNRTWGYDAVQLGTASYRNQVGHITRGNWVYGCASYGDVTYPFAHFDSSNVLAFRVDSGGNMEIGKNGTGVVATPYMDFHSSGNTVDYDVRLIFQGGTTSNGQGTMQVAAATLVSNNHEPATNNVSSLGSASKVWTAGYFAALSASAFTVDSVELGTSAGTKVLDFHSSGNAIDYDSRIEASGGSATVGAGALTIRSASLDIVGTMRPSADVGAPLGQTTRRYSNGFIQTLRPGAGAVVWTSGTGTPEGAVTAPVGSLFTRTDGGASTTLYVKESGTGATGWVAK